MEKEVFKKLSEKYSPLIKWLIESNQIYTSVDKTIKWRFAWDENLAMTAAVDRKTNVLSVNALFVDDAYKNNRIFEIEYFLLHEMRHIYQHIQIAKYKDGKNDVGSQYIEKWIKENENYEQSVDKAGIENINYPKQDCELDAYAFAYTVMHCKYHGMYDSFLYVPEIYKNELRKDFGSALEDFAEHLKF